MEPCGDGIATRPCETVCGLGARQTQSSTSTTLGRFERSDRDADKARIAYLTIVLMVVLNHRSCQSFFSPSLLGCTHAELLYPVFLTECTSTIKTSCLLFHHGLWTFSVDHYVTAWSGRPARIRSRTFVIAALFLSPSTSSIFYRATTASTTTLAL
jgi:hypothetical protein